MAGSDQSARLQGLLSGIADSVGGLGAGGEWTSNAVRTAARPDFTSGMFGNPKFDMNNVDNLNAMANWASRNGYEDQAKQYMALGYRQKEKEAQEAKDAASLSFMKGTSDATKGGVMFAQEGDVNNLDARIAGLRARQEAAPDTANLSKLNAEILRLESLRGDAVKKQTSNHARAVNQIDSSLADPSLNSVAREALSERRVELLKNPEVQEIAAKQKYEQARVGRLAREEAGKAYATQNIPAIQSAIVRGDDDAVDSIIENAPAEAQAGLMATVETLRSYEDDRQKREKVIADTATPYNFEEAEARLAEIPEEFRAGIEAALKKLESADQRSGGTVINATASQNARQEVEDAFRAANQQVASISYSQRAGQESRRQDEIETIESKMSVYEPDDTKVKRRAEILAKQEGSYIGPSRNRKLNVTSDHLTTARQQLKDQAMREFNADLARLRGEDVPPPQTDASTPSFEQFSKDARDRGQTDDAAIRQKYEELYGPLQP